MAATIRSTQNRSWTRRWPLRPSMSASGWSVSSRHDGVGQRGRVVWRHEQAGDAVLDHLGDAAHVGRHHRACQRHGLEDDQALCLAVGGQDGDVERGGDRGHVLAAAREHDLRARVAHGGCPRSASPSQGSPSRPSASAWSCSSSGQRALADDQQAGRRGPVPAPSGHASSSVAWPFSGSSRATTPTSGRPFGEAVLLGQRAARLGVVVARQVDPVVDELDGRRGRRGPRAPAWPRWPG